MATRFALGVILATISWRSRIAYVGSCPWRRFANVYVVLTTLYPKQPVDGGWLGIGPSDPLASRGRLFSLMHAAAFVWRSSQLRAGARERLEEELAGASVERVAGRQGRLRQGVGRPRRRTPPMPPATATSAAPLPPVVPAMTMAIVEPPPVLPTAATTAASTAAIEAVAAPMPSWTPRARFEDVGIIGWFRARFSDLRSGPTGARSSGTRAAGGWTGSTCGSSSSSSSGR